MFQTFTAARFQWGFCFWLMAPCRYWLCYWWFGDIWCLHLHSEVQYGGSNTANIDTSKSHINNRVIRSLFPFL